MELNTHTRAHTHTHTTHTMFGARRGAASWAGVCSVPLGVCGGQGTSARATVINR